MMPAAPGRRRLLTVVAAAVAATAVALGVRADVSVRHDARHARAGASRDAKHRRALAEQVDRTQVTLAATRAQLATDEAVLAETTRERDALSEALGAATRDLAGVRASVGGAQLQLLAGNSQIESLGRCLNGVQNALNAAAVGDSRSAVRALAAVSDSCGQVS